MKIHDPHPKIWGVATPSSSGLTPIQSLKLDRKQIILQGGGLSWDQFCSLYSLQLSASCVMTTTCVNMPMT